MTIKERRQKEFINVVAIFIFLFISLGLVACTNNEAPAVDSENPEENSPGTEESDTPKVPESNQDDEEDTQNIDNVTSAEIKKITNCDPVTAALGDFAANYELDDSHFDEEGFSCFYTPMQEASKESQYITVIGQYEVSLFETAEELKEHEIYDIYEDERVETFGGVVYGLNEDDGNDVMTHIQTPDFELTLNVTGDLVDTMYGEPAIDVLLELIEY